MSTAYRIHSQSESLDTVLDPSRRDGWVADDESVETQPHGVSACGSLADLARYSRKYNMGVKDGDLVVELIGTESRSDDRDEHAVRFVASSYRVVATGAQFRIAAQVWLDHDVASWGDEEWEEAEWLHDVAPEIRSLLESMVD